jgi:hypothetical protein
MRSVREWTRRTAAAAAVATAAGACAPGAPDPAAADAPASPAHARAQPALAPAPDPAAWEALEARVHAEADSVDRALRRVPNLSAAEQAALRRDVNDPQTARARALGVRAGNAYEEAAARGRLVRLADSTEYWVVRELDFSVPYVTPGAEAMLAELGRRFHAALDTLGVPRYRMDVTSVLRTPAKQAALRRTNPNAAAGVSAHEFGTTLDVAYRSFIPPAGEAAGTHPAHAAPAAALRDSLLAETAHQRSAELQAVLGRVLLEMRREGKLMVMMERQQTVYHMTVARRFPGAQRVPPVTGTGTVQPPRAEEPVSAER